MGHHTRIVSYACTFGSEPVERSAPSLASSTKANPGCRTSGSSVLFVDPDCDGLFSGELHCTYKRNKYSDRCRDGDARFGGRTPYPSPSSISHDGVRCCCTCSRLTPRPPKVAPSAFARETT